MSGAEITLLKFPDHVRLRTSMYLYSVNHCLMEIIDNSVDEYNAGYAKHITIKAEDVPGGEFPLLVVTDDGRGIPTSPSKDPEHLDECQAEVALGNLNAGGKFGTEGGYKTVTSGLHGVGASCVNATSSVFRARIWHDGTLTVLEYEKGLLKKKSVNQPVKAAGSGTEISFVLDESIWHGNTFDYEAVRKRVRELAYLNPGLEITFERNGKTESYKYDQGIAEYYKELTSTKTMLNTEPVVISKVVNSAEAGDIELNIYIGYNAGYSNDTRAYVNNVYTTGGDHINGFNAGIARAVNVFYSGNSKYKNAVKNLTGEDCRDGLIAIISVKVMYPKFEGQGKLSINMPQIRPAVYDVVVTEFQDYLDKHPSFVKVLAEKLERAAKARIAAKRARDAVRSAKSATESSLPGKLAACSSKKPEECSLYIVEGDSAAGSAIQGRDPKTQAILPVFGKILNCVKVREDEVLKSDKILDVIKALKCGIGKTFDISKLRYHKIIIMADADVDGAHISCLWTTFFYTYLPQLIEHGYLYIQLSPLYRVTEYVGKKETHHYFFNDEELAGFSTRNKTHVAYLKGLGELQPQQLWESTMDPANRRLVQVTMEDAENCARAIDICMGDNVNIRRDFILRNADFSEVE